MDPFTLLGVAFGLAVDAFSVAVGTAISLGSVHPRQAFRLSFHFGLFQFLMPVVGWLVGSRLENLVASYDHWVAFGLLAYVGGKMLWEAFTDDGTKPKGDPTRGRSLVLLSVATSIDALAVGFGLALVGVPVLVPAVVIGVVAASMTLLGLLLGRRVGQVLDRRLTAFGGLVLLAIGVKILLDHLQFP